MHEQARLGIVRAGIGLPGAGCVGEATSAKQGDHVTGGMQAILQLTSGSNRQRSLSRHQVWCRCRCENWEGGARVENVYAGRGGRQAAPRDVRL